MIVNNKRLLILTSSAIGLLFIPLIAMLFTNEVNWNVLDFVVAGILLLTVVLVIEFVLRKVKQPRNRIIFIFVIVMLILLLWIELAVGFFDTPLSGS